MPQTKPSQKEREETRKKLLAAEAALLLLLMRALRQDRDRKAALAKALLLGQMPIRQLARARLAAELRKDVGFVAKKLPADVRKNALSLAAKFSRFVTERRKQSAQQVAVDPSQSVQALRRNAEKAIQNRLRQIATSETVRAFEDERRKAIEEIQSETKEKTTKVWDAYADACDVCSQYDGKELDIDDDFPEGDPPLHPNCRCSLEYRLGT